MTQDGHGIKALLRIEGSNNGTGLPVQQWALACVAAE